MLDGLAYDGLSGIPLLKTVDAYDNVPMGLCAEKTVSDFKLSREIQDDYCITSYERTIDSIQSNRFVEEIVPVQVGTEMFSTDEEVKRYNKIKIPGLKPVFSKTGTITAANSSKTNDGACAVGKTRNQALLPPP